MQSIKEMPKLRLILLILIVLMLICAVGIIIYYILFGENGGGGQPTPTPTFTPTSEGPVVIITPEEQPTVTPTRVVEETTPELTDTPTAIPEPTEEPTATPTEQPTVDLGLTPIVSPGVVGDLLQNGDFESGFEQGVGVEWQSFNTDGVAVAFSSETAEPYIKSGSAAQRIAMSGATQGNRYAGIYQQVNIVPGHVYSLTLYGQIRSGFADVNLSSYGYRLQYAIDHNGGDNWQDVPEVSWVELPWDEQLINSPDVEFLSYSTTITTTSDEITLFIRAWNKWADPGEVHYTLDNLSLVGSSRFGEPEPGETLVDQPLPTTGADDVASFVGSARFWGALLVLLLLVVGAIYRGKWSY